MGQGLVTVLGDDNSLATCEPIILDDVGSPEFVEGCTHRIEVTAGSRCGGGNTGRSHDLLGEGLRAFQPSSLGTRTEAIDPCVAQGVCHPRDQRGLRADDDKVGRNLAGKGDDGVLVARVDGMVRGEGCRSGVTGGGMDGSDLWVSVACQSEGMLATTRSEDDNSHAGHDLKSRGCSRPFPDRSYSSPASERNTASSALSR